MRVRIDETRRNSQPIDIYGAFGRSIEPADRRDLSSSDSNIAVKTRHTGTGINSAYVLITHKVAVGNFIAPAAAGFLSMSAIIHRGCESESSVWLPSGFL